MYCNKIHSVNPNHSYYLNHLDLEAIWVNILYTTKNAEQTTMIILNLKIL